MDERRIREIHDAGRFLALAITGGGASAIAHLLSVPGASRSIVEANVPYHPAALADFLGKRPEQAASGATARMMAMTARERARRTLNMARGDEGLLGVACTAALTTDRSRRGANRCYIAIQSAAETREIAVMMDKGTRTRREEEDLCAAAVIEAIRTALGLQRQIDLTLEPGEDLELEVVAASQAWQSLLCGETDSTWAESTPPRAVFPGTFSPLHEGHEGMIEIAAEMLNTDIVLEVSVFNVDKAPLDFIDMARRTENAGQRWPLVFTAAPTFVEKARLFPGATFVVGIDTMERIVSSHYYNDSDEARDRALDEIRDLGNRFLVFGRMQGGSFRRLEDIDLPAPIRDICTAVPEDRFRMDISSTRLRSERTDVEDHFK